MAALARLAKLKRLMDWKSVYRALSKIQLPVFRRMFGMWHCVIQ